MITNDPQIAKDPTIEDYIEWGFMQRCYVTGSVWPAKLMIEVDEGYIHLDQITPYCNLPEHGWNEEEKQAIMQELNTKIKNET